MHAAYFLAYQAIGPDTKYGGYMADISNYMDQYWGTIKLVIELIFVHI